MPFTIRLASWNERPQARSPVGESGTQIIVAGQRLPSAPAGTVGLQRMFAGWQRPVVAVGESGTHTWVIPTNPCIWRALVDGARFISAHHEGRALSQADLLVTRRTWHRCITRGCGSQGLQPAAWDAARKPDGERNQKNQDAPAHSIPPWLDTTLEFAWSLWRKALSTVRPGMIVASPIVRSRS